MPTAATSRFETLSRWLLSAVVAFASLGLCPCPTGAVAEPTPGASEAHACCGEENDSTPLAPSQDRGCAHCAPAEAPIVLAEADPSLERVASTAAAPLLLWAGGPMPSYAVVAPVTRASTSAAHGPKPQARSLRALRTRLQV